MLEAWAHSPDTRRRVRIDDQVSATPRRSQGGVRPTIAAYERLAALQSKLSTAAQKQANDLTRVQQMESGPWWLPGLSPVVNDNEAARRYDYLHW